MSSYRSTLTRKGQATIPIELREKLGLQEGDTLVWQELNGTVTVIGAREYIQRMRGMLKPMIDPSIPSPAMEEIKEAAAAGWIERAKS